LKLSLSAWHARAAGTENEFRFESHRQAGDSEGPHGDNVPVELG